MHAPSALLAGVVLTFGVTALANLYLPPASVVAQTAASAFAPASDLPAWANPPATQGESVFEEAPAIELPESQSAALESATTPVEPVATPVVAVASEPEPKPAAAPGKKSEPVRKAAEVQKNAETANSKAKSSATSKREVSAPEAEPWEAPAQFAPIPASSVFAEGSEAKSAAGASSVSVSAISGDRAWIRIGDTRTVAVRAGEQVGTFGRVKEIKADSVTFESGLILKVAP